VTIRDSIIAAAALLHRINAAICHVLLAILFVAQIVIVILRYAFGIGFLELQDLVSYSFAMLLVLSIPVALRLDRHVRVDVFRSRQEFSVRRRFDRIGIVFFLLPLFGMTLYFVMPQIFYSWSIRESGVETGGLAGYFLVKTALPVACALILLQGAALFLGETIEADPFDRDRPGGGHGV